MDSDDIARRFVQVSRIIQKRSPLEIVEAARVLASTSHLLCFDPSASHLFQFPMSFGKIVVNQSINFWIGLGPCSPFRSQSGALASHIPLGLSTLRTIKTVKPSQQTTMII
jgi:hypothetical protein